MAVLALASSCSARVSADGVCMLSLQAPRCPSVRLPHPSNVLLQAAKKPLSRQPPLLLPLA
eukprot:436971-Amphidinium_carterae.1